MTSRTTRDVTVTGEEAAIARSAEMVLEKLDLILDRVTDNVLGIPTSNSPQWRSMFHHSDEITRVLHSARRAELRAPIAARVGVADPAAPLHQHQVTGTRHAETTPSSM